MIRLPLRDRPRPIIVTPELRARWRTYEAANRAAAEVYPGRVYRNAMPGCAGGCGTEVWAAGRMCEPCRRDGR